MIFSENGYTFRYRFLIFSCFKSNRCFCLISACLFLISQKNFYGNFFA
jgi:hypothetical protein